MSKYEYAKQSPNFPKDYVDKLKNSLKIYILGQILRQKTKEKIFEKVYKEIDDFIIEFPTDTEKEKLIQQQTRDELIQFSQECYNMAFKATKGIPPALFAQILAGKKISSNAKKLLLQSGHDDKAELIVTQDQGTGRDLFKDTLQDKLKEYKPKDYAYSMATSADTYYKDVQKEIKSFFNDYKDKLVTKDYIANVNVRSLAEMNIRFEKYQADKQRLIQQGVKLVYVPPHANCSERCKKWQGRIYSLDHSSGTVDGRKYIPLEDAAENVTVQGKIDPSRTYYAGLFSYNCRHTLEPYQEGQNIELIPDDVIKRRRQLEETQREMERFIRKHREQMLLYYEVYNATKDEDIHQKASYLRGYLASKRVEYYKFCRKNNLVIYEDRLKVVVGANEYKKTIGKDDPYVQAL